ncbi:thioredoxin-like protein 4A [Sinocyclocheilus anshuiensis]|uniref:thioredoxin-like protein 4A n=1 Tax=Sinocyclocheilus anshuiensis TaxID=1608454 RepID=UPI0007B93E65|nr:PREDICTED: thioredoxin-like protein 4A [Sinocyclocheilus anshuiensis]
MSYMLPHLHNGWQVDQAILSEEDRVIVIRFGHDWDPTCMKMDEVLYSIAEKVKNFAVIYLVDITEVPDFNKMYELYDPCTVMFFFRSTQPKSENSPIICSPSCRPRYTD